MESRKGYEMIFKLNAQLGAQFTTSFNKAQTAIAQTQKEIQALNKTQGDISAYQKADAALTSSRQKLQLLEKEYEDLQVALEKTKDEQGNFTEASEDLRTQLLRKNIQIKDTEKAISSYEAKLESAGKSLKDAKVDTNNLTEASERLAAEYDELRKKQQEQIDSFNGSGKHAKVFSDTTASAVADVRDAFVAAGIVKLVQEIGEAMVVCTKESIAFESAITGVYKTVDGSEQQLAAISDEIKELSTEIPTTKEEIGAVAEAAGQLGIATDAVMSFTGVMIDLGESTNLSSEEAASSLAKFSNITGTAATEYSRLGSVIVDLGNNYATTEADIVAMSTRLASAGKLAGLTEAEIMALATAMSSVGIEAEAGGTAMTQTLSAIEEAVVTGGDELYEYARIAGMSADEFATAWETSPIQAIQSFIAGIGELDQKGESAVLVLDALGLSGIRQSNMLKSLGLAANTLAGAVNTANTAWEEDIALSVEAGKRYATTESRLAMLGNSYSNLKVAIGDVYMPALNGAIDVGQDALDSMTEYVEKNPQVVKGVTALAAGFGTAGASLGTLVAVVKLGKAAMTALNSTMLLNPWVLGATAILGVAAAIGTLVATNQNEAIPSVKELTEATREMNEVMEEAQTVYDETSTAAMATADVADRYISKLEELEAAGIDTEEEAKAYHNTLALLTQLVPELSEQIDLQNDVIIGGTAALRENTAEWKANAIAQAQQKQMTALAESYNDVLIEQTKNEIGLENAELRRKNAQEMIKSTQERMIELMNEEKQASEDFYEQNEKGISSADLLWKEYYTLSDALDQYTQEEIEASKIANQYQEALELNKEAAAEAEEQYNLTAEAIARYTGATEYNTGANENNARQIQEVNDLLGSVQDEMALLTEEYDKAYEAARESIEGQYQLWDEAADVIIKSADEINAAMADQATYWQSYNADLQALSARASEIEGLGEMLTAFADGSEGSVNAIAGMAAASDEELALMVQSWQELQNVQNDTKRSLAELQTGYSEQINALVKETQDSIGEMNLSAEAYESGKATVQGFIDAAEVMLPEAQSAYAKVARAATLELFYAKIRGSVYGVNEYASGTHSAEPGFALVGEEGPELVYFKGGEQVLTAQETAALRANTSTERMQTVTAARTPIYEAASSSGGSVPSVTLQVEYNISALSGEDLPYQLSQSAENLRDFVRQTVTEIVEDNNRRSYR